MFEDGVLPMMIYNEVAETTKQLPPSAKKIFFPNSATRTAAVTFPCLADGRDFLLAGGKVETSSDLFRPLQTSSDLLLALLFRKLSINN